MNSKFNLMAAKQLTSRQVEVLKLVAHGYPQKSGADALGIGVKTFEKHLYLIREKLGLHSNVALTHYAIANGHVKPGECV